MKKKEFAAIAKQLLPELPEIGGHRKSGTEIGGHHTVFF